MLEEVPAHTHGAPIILAADFGVLFTGDLVEDRFYLIMPDTDFKGAPWITSIGLTAFGGRPRNGGTLDQGLTNYETFEGHDPRFLRLYLEM
ncbi:MULTISPECIES: hypothetical protein [Sphingomonadaceae]|uniref:hypothetical protein n=1 Tax=Sphingomonadaceae TaxID=41297 RepID=UPI0011578242|nr:MULTISPECIES: hypothetical protein [Sphingomonadaceae]QDK35722.1 hypothetical protein DM450_23640 [Sphingomonas sp. IC081]QSR20491.1 hypothetical protein CA833_25535 [Novosphingobium sp. KA1]